MKEITREDLLKAGFTEKEIVRLDDAIHRGGGEAGDYGSSIKDLRKIFTSGAWSFVFLLVVYIIVLMHYREGWIGISVSFGFAFLVFYFIIPVSLAFKGFRLSLMKK